MRGGYSKEVFDSFCGWLILQGKKIYLEVLKEPDSLAELEVVKEYSKRLSLWNSMTTEQFPKLGVYISSESISQAAVQAYQEKTESQTSFEEMLLEFPLATEEINTIKSEFIYAIDIYIEWYTDEVGEFGLDKLVPRLYKLFN